MKRYDFVVLGAGSAGIAATWSLARKFPDASILLVEQGPRDHPPLFCKAPLLQPFIQWSRKTRPFTRVYTTEPDEHLGNRRHTILKGRGLGGSSLTDCNLYLRGSHSDYAAWKQERWSWDNCLPAYKRMERNSRGASTVHGEEGPLSVRDPLPSETRSVLNMRFVETCEAAGLLEVGDFNGGLTDGFGSYQSISQNGTRQCLFDALLNEERHRTKQLVVQSGTTVEKLEFDGSNRCVGITVSANNSQETIACGKVVCCLGVIETPALLLRSGIGSAENVAGGKALVPLDGVGNNLIAPPTVDVAFGYTFRNVLCKAINFRNMRYMFQQWKEYGEEATGAFTSLSEVGAFVRSADDGPFPDLHLRFTRMPVLDGGRKFCNQFGYTVSVTNMYPKSRGVVRLSNNSATQVRLGLLDSEDDVKTLDEGVMWVGLLAGPTSSIQSPYYETPDGKFHAPFSSLTPTLIQPKGLATAEASVAFIEQSSYVGDTMFGTCAMNSVVDETLSVIGCEGLKIADASVVPCPMAATDKTISLMIGMRVAEFL